MGYKGGPCWYCGKDLEGMSRTNPDEFYKHMNVDCPDSPELRQRLKIEAAEYTATQDEDERYQEYLDSLPVNPCGHYLIIEKRKFTCTQKTHPQNKHHGKSWNNRNQQYDFVSWDVSGLASPAVVTHSNHTQPGHSTQPPVTRSPELTRS